MKSNALSFIRLGDIADFRNGLNFSKESHGKGCPLIGVGDFKDNFSPKWDELEEINPDGVSKVEDYLKEGDLLFVRSNGNKALVGRSLYINKDIKALYSGFCIRARLKTDDICPLFLAYFTKTQFFRDAISFVAGTNINNLNQGILSEVRIPSYSKEKQALIVKALSSIDKKIELNNRINSELEAMAKTLYDYWFVQFDFPDTNGKPYKASGGKMVYNDTLKREIPVGWSDGTLDNLGQIVGGSTPSTADKNNFSEQGSAWITPNDLSGNIGNKFISKGAMGVTAEGIKSASLKKYPAGTVLLSSRAPIGYMAIARNALTTNQGFKSFIPSKGYPTEFVYFTVKNSLKAIIQYASGSTFKEVSGTVIKTVKLALPPNELVEEFREKVEDLFKRQDTLEQENEQLIALRDWLLPMLMNGQVTVKPSTEAQEAQHG
ncbi:restriction endonuclease subunit S [Vibrio parahaemolyticus]|nr:restriction endonuclease subunit S [Vibrio parahaemolyticus]EJG2002357.1 restriction endonuclease subunit S [Vibrio parahaemolyticus]EJG2039843.1 restriction endonuclease subunit S [Vibrio parahaemolyticus]EJG2043979.1 restriction endonuclease subunit S [Vibrio parahaemolyticus]EJG2235279.1 restriction endonuclease subunit S [Vibrio parahaemolyticus]